jgi:hypothetical protein
LVRSGPSDNELLLLAAAGDRVVVSGDIDFGALVPLLNRRSPSVILFRSRNTLTAADQAAIVLDHLDDPSQISTLVQPSWSAMVGLGCVSFRCSATTGSESAEAMMRRLGLGSVWLANASLLPGLAGTRRTVAGRNRW